MGRKTVLHSEAISVVRTYCYDRVMEKADLAKIARLAGIVYIPIALLVVFIFLLVSYERAKISALTPPTTETAPLNSN